MGNCSLNSVPENPIVISKLQFKQKRHLINDAARHSFSPTVKNVSIPQFIPQIIDRPVSPLEKPPKQTVRT